MLIYTVYTGNIHVFSNIYFNTAFYIIHSLLSILNLYIHTTSINRPPADCCAEFEVERIEIPANTTDYHPITVDCGSLLLLLQSTSDHPSVKVTTVRTNESLLLREGGVVFTGANEEISITTGETGATFYRAHVNLGDA